MRRGSLEERYRRCGKTGCRCANREHPGHGPVFVLTRKLDGRTVSEIISPEKVETVKAQLEHWHSFQKLSKELIEVNEQICQMQVTGSEKKLRSGPGESPRLRAKTPFATK